MCALPLGKSCPWAKVSEKEQGTGPGRNFYSHSLHPSTDDLVTLRIKKNLAYHNLSPAVIIRKNRVSLEQGKEEQRSPVGGLIWRDPRERSRPRVHWHSLWCRWIPGPSTNFLAQPRVSYSFRSLWACNSMGKVRDHTPYTPALIPVLFHLETVCPHVKPRSVSFHQCWVTQQADLG